jgi:Ca-activated chloride channel homolog
MRLLSKLTFFLALAATALAQDEGAIFRSETRLVVLHATVADNKGHLITDLSKDAFRVLENGVEQQLKLFRREDIPVSAGMVIDNSGSMKNTRKRVEAASINLVKASNPQDEVFIVNFNDEAILDVTMTSDIKKMEEGLARIDSRGGTAMRDAIVMSLDYLKEKGKKDKKVLLIVTDGDDTASIISIEKCIQEVQKSEAVIYAIGLLNEESVRDQKRAKRALDAITHATGGVAYYPKGPAEVEQIAQQVAHELRNQYTLAYTPTKPDDGSYRTIKVTAKGPRNPVVRTRSGYYAGKPAAPVAR